MEFLGVIMVVLADAENVFCRTRKRREQFDAGGRNAALAAFDRLARTRQALFAQRDKGRHFLRQPGRCRQVNNRAGFLVVHADACALGIRKSNQTHSVHSLLNNQKRRLWQRINTKS
jgi:hypothetical protein